MAKRIAIESTAEAYLELLAARGVEYLFANAGTDFAPIIEALRQARALRARRMPRPITVPHESAGGGAWPTAMPWSRGRAQAVMVHVIVGAANALERASSMPRAAQVPILFSAGRTPHHRGRRCSAAATAHIHWAQEILRPGGRWRASSVKWDYELRNFAQLETVVDRALAMAQVGAAQGPVYLTLPREVLSLERHETFEYAEPEPPAEAGPASRPRRPTSTTRPQILAGAQQSDHHHQRRRARIPSPCPRSSALAETLGAPVFQDTGHHYIELSRTHHPLHAGYDAAAHLEEADVDPRASRRTRPGIRTSRARARTTARDPGGARTRSSPAIRSAASRADLTLWRAPRASTLPRRWPRPGRDSSNAARSRRAAPHWECASITRTAKQDVGRSSATAVCEGCLADRHWRGSRGASPIASTSRRDRGQRVRPRHDPVPSLSEPAATYFAALAVERSRLGHRRRARGQARRAATRRVICCVGDGAYIFGVAHRRALGLAPPTHLPVLFVVFNNRAWNAVRNATP